MDFAAIQDAVDAAADLDLIVVREGDYGQLVITNKALTVVGVGGPVLMPLVAFGNTTVVDIHDLAAGKSVVLRGLLVRPFLGADEAPAVRLTNNFGPIVLEDMECTTPNGAGVSAINCASVTLTRCIANGGTEVDLFAGIYLTHAGIFGRDSDLYVYDTVATGSTGGNSQLGFSFPPTPDLFPGRGKAGLQLQGGSLLSTGSTFIGGDSGDDAVSLCVPASDGGPGLSIDSFNTTPTVRLLDTTLVPGTGGASGPGCGLADGAAGLPIEQSSGTLESLPGTARSFDWTSPVVGGELFDMHFSGQAGDLILLLITIGPGPDDYLDGYGAALLIDPFFVSAVIDFVPASGELTQTLTAVEPGLIDYVRLSAQAAFIDTLGQFFLSAPSTLTILTPEDVER